MAAQWWGLDYFGEFTQLTGVQQGYLVAVYESRIAIDAVLSEAQAKSTS